MSPKENRLHRFWKGLGPGLITGAADDDPSGIATYSQAGAQFGFALTWTMLLTLPFMAAIQIISACIGWQTGNGLAKNIALRLPRPLLLLLVGALVVANTINIAADLAAMGEAVRLLIGGRTSFYALAFGIVCLLAEVLIPYHDYAGYLKYLTMVLLVYVAVALSIDVPWGTVMVSALLPKIDLSRDMLLTVVAVFGTTISPYLFFWQASQEAEESRLSHARLRGTSEFTPSASGQIATDTWVGMFFSNLVAFFIIVTTGATLHVHGATGIETASQAAEALRPIAGDFTFFFFAAGIVGTGLLAVPVLAGSSAYAVAEVIGVAGSLELPANRAKSFYAIVGAATLGGAVLTATNLDPIAMLFWSAVINGVVAVPIMLVMMLVVAMPKDAPKIILPVWVTILGWLASALMALTVGLMIWSSLRSPP